MAVQVMEATQADRFDGLFREHHLAVRAYAQRRSISADAADDAVAETFLVAWRRLDDVPADPLPWLLGVARKVLANQRRSQHRGAALGQRLAEMAPVADGDPAALVGEAETMRQAFARLSPRDQELLLSAGWGDESSAAADAGVRSNTLAVRLHRARTRLQTQLAALEGTPLLILVLAVTVALLVLTPQGRAGLSWAAQRIGIGRVGGPPSLSDRSPLKPTSRSVVVQTGRAPDNSRYELVASRGPLQELQADRRAAAATGLCLSLEWPDHPQRNGLLECSGRPELRPPAAEQSDGPIRSIGYRPVQRPGRARPHLLVRGTSSGQVARLEIDYAGRGRLPTNFARVSGDLLIKLGLPPGKPGRFGTFVAFVPAAKAARDGLTGRYPEPTILVDRQLRTGQRRFDECARRRGRPAPFTLTAYDARGRVIEVRRTLSGRSLPSGCARLRFARKP